MSSNGTATATRKSNKAPSQVRQPNERAVIEQITPEQAERYLSNNTDINRRRSEHKVERYARFMTAGEWILTPEPIAFDENCMLIEGQHRLAAVVKSGLAQSFWVIRGCSKDAFLKIGGGGRNSSDTFTILYKQRKGEAPSHATHVTAIATAMLRRISEKGGTEERDSIAEVALLRYERIHNYISLLGLNRTNPGFNTPLAAAFVNASLYYGDSQIEPLAKMYGDEMWPSINHPLKMLHARMVKTKMRDLVGKARREAQLSHKEKYAQTVACIRAALEGKALKRVEPSTLDFGAHSSDKTLRNKGEKATSAA